MDNRPLIVEPYGEAATIVTLNRPQRRNALSVELLEALCRVLEALAGHPEQRVMILRGAGPVFCAGLDLHEAAQPEAAEHCAAGVARALTALTGSPLVLIAAVHGAAYAGGAGLMAACDLVVAADGVRIGFPEVRRGLVPALVSVVLEERIRRSDVRQLFLLGEPIDAVTALAMGLVHRLVPADQVLAEAQRMADQVLLGAPEAVRHTKRLLQELASPTHDHRFARALEHHTRARLSAEAQEGLAAFQQHRPPQWPTGSGGTP